MVVIDKPQGMTSHDVVAKMRRHAGTRKVGHAGTLDPMATGVLVIGVGRATRLLHYLTSADKSYTATVRLGIGTVSEDADGDVTCVEPVPELSREKVAAAAVMLTGVIQQIPSSVSALKIDGQRAYDLVRAGKEVELSAREVRVSRFDVLAVRPGFTDAGQAITDVDFSVDVSSGTYVRALGRDLAAALGTCGHLIALRRTSVAQFALDRARTLAELEKLDVNTPLETMSMSTAVQGVFPVVEVSHETAVKISHGQRLSPVDTDGTGRYAAVSESGSLLAVVEDNGSFGRPVTVFAPAE
nr:tRNA pseudouridine(55) synthase TruB [Jonesia quinghaiensis]